ncbi:MAG: hypothetical protein AB1634_17105 [Thermodesulfobacteriota bacterium]
MTWSTRLQKKLQDARLANKKKRLAIFKGVVAGMPRPLRVVDLGGTASFWTAWGFGHDGDLRVTLVNNHEQDRTNVGYDNSIPYVKEEINDVRHLTADCLKEFDLVFSNSMIEHLTSHEEQFHLGLTIEQSGVAFFVQTPNKYSIVDPHFPHPLVPFFGAYPKTIQGLLLTMNRLGSGARAASLATARGRLRYYHPVSAGQLQAMLPSGQLVRERFLGFCHSLIAIRR